MGIKYVFNPTTGNLDATSVELPAGSTTQIQFNDAGAFGGDAGLTYDKSTDALTSGSLSVTSAGAAATPSLTFTSDPNTGIYSPGADQLAASTAGVERLRIDANGRLLVGISSGIPTQFPSLFQVNGAVGYAADFGRFTDDNFGAYISLSHGRGGSPGVRGIVLNGDTLGVIDFVGDDGASLIPIGAKIAGEVDGIPGVGDMPGRLVFSTTADGLAAPTERLRIDSAGQIEAGSLGTAAAPVWSFLADPNTGIFSPGADQLALSTGGAGRLFVDATGNVFVATASKATSPTFSLRQTGAVQWNTSVTTTDGHYQIGIDSGGVGYLATRSALAIDTHRFSTAGSERLRITSTGNVGIGTSSPSVNLDVVTAGNVSIKAQTTDTSGVNIGQLVASYTGGGGGTASSVSLRAGDGYTLLSATTNSPLLLATNNAERLRITSTGVLQVADAGNIQVGTTTGTKIGTATTQKLGFYNATPVVQPAAVADATTAVDVITQLNDLLAKLRTLGIIAT